MEQLNLAPKLKNILDDFLQVLKDAYNEGLVSVIAYGSAASGEFANKHSNINLLILLKDTGIINLRKVTKYLNKSKFRLIHPIFFTEEYIRNSSDVFPIEFLDMKENYFCLYGKDVLKDLGVDIKNLRFQCEQELKVKLINLKSAYLRNTNKDALRVLLIKSFTSIVHILRNVVRLKGKIPSYQKEEVLQQIACELNIDTENFKMLLEVKNKNLRLGSKETELLFINFVQDLENIINKVDKL